MVFWFILCFVAEYYSMFTFTNCNSNNFDDLTTVEPRLPLVIGTWADDKAWETLAAGESRLSSLVAGLSECERLQCGFTVGWGGSPDELGETTLDSLIMDGPEHLVGAVAQLRRVKNAASVAWAVMNYTKHSLLVGEKATKFAIAMGFEESSLNSKQAEKMRKDWLSENCQPNFWKNVLPNSDQSCGPYQPNNSKLNENISKIYSFNELNHDTIGIIIIDEHSDISAGTSSNGATFKIPGRVGDSSVPGSGAYVDNDIGAAVATGDGDVMMRFTPSFLAVELMRSQRATPSEAARQAIFRVKKFHPNFFGAVVVANRRGQYGAACNGMEQFKYSINNSPLNVHGETIIEAVNCEK